MSGIFFPSNNKKKQLIEWSRGGKENPLRVDYSLAGPRKVQEAVKLVKRAYARNGLLLKARTRGMDFC